MDGFFLINKEVGWTSRDVCNKVSHLFNTKKVGHYGTLDPFAEGLLVVGLNKATKAGSFLKEDKKEYIATLKLGEKTKSGDNTSEVIQTKEIPALTKQDIIDVLNSFLGDSYQIPPMTSAIHYNGKKLYDLARSGIEVEREKRLIHIFEIKLLDFQNNIIIFQTTVSKGTYIRTLSEDIALKLNTVGHLIKLQRTKIGSISIENTKKVNDLISSDVQSIYDVLSSFYQTIELNNFLTKEVMNGKKLVFHDVGDEIFLVDENKNPIAIYIKEKDNIYRCKRGLF